VHPLCYDEKKKRALSVFIREKSRRLSLLPDLESLIVFMKRLLSESQRFCVFSVNFREILGNGQASASPKSDLYQMRTLAESLAEYAGIDGTGCVIGPWELLLIPDAPIERSEKMVVVPKIREFFLNSASLEQRQLASLFGRFNKPNDA